MPVAFKELGGSPLEQYDAGGFSARREFLIAWEDRDAFAVEVLGEATASGGRNATAYPGKNAACALRVSFQPVDPEQPDSQELGQLAVGLNDYSGSFAKAIVEYGTLTPRDRLDGPENEAGTHITYAMSHAVGDATVRPGGWLWEDNSQAISTYYKLSKRVPVSVHYLTWHNVVNPPWTAIHQLQGKTNDAAFLGCPAGTVLFDGAEAEKTFRAGAAAVEPSFAWTLKYLFREHSIKSAGSVYGWNHIYRESPPGWVKITNGTGYLYDAGDFGALFVSESS